MKIALIKKEFLQIIRDPSRIISAFVLPLMSVLIYMYGINLDSVTVTIGVKDDDGAPEIATLVKSFGHSEYVDSIVYESEEQIDDAITRSKIRVAVIIPNDFSSKLAAGKIADLMIITDGAEVNTANYVQSYATSIANLWLSSSKYRYLVKPNIVNPDLRVWYNQDLNSHYFILPGSISVTMTLIGILLTALVVAREWERGTMEALLGVDVRKIDIVLGKYIPYFVLGMISIAFNVFLCVGVFRVPFRGSYLVLFAVSALFLFNLLGVGLIISSKLRSQFLASQVAMGIGFLPALMLSGLMFPINSMPKIFQWFTMIIPPRYFITFIESEFMAGTVWELVAVNAVFLIVLGSVLFFGVYKNTRLTI
ncbi:ABC transporter permease [bacterium]|nr:ABC transporter permease [bacterium]